MGSFGGFYKGDKKKKKKDTNDKPMNTTSAPVFTLPKLIEKKKNKWE